MYHCRRKTLNSIGQWRILDKPLWRLLRSYWTAEQDVPVPTSHVYLLLDEICVNHNLIGHKKTGHTSRSANYNSRHIRVCHKLSPQCDLSDLSFNLLAYIICHSSETSDDLI